MKRRTWLWRTAGAVLGWREAAHAADTARAPDAKPLTLGINVLWGPGDADTLRARFRRVRALGLREVRLDWEWREAQPRANDPWRWASFDTLVRVAQAEGVGLLPIVHYAPDWALRSGRKASDVYEMAPREEAWEGFARFLLACIRRYGPQGDAPVPFNPIRHWQVWNEPNQKQFWGPEPDPAAFARFMQVVARTLAPVRAQVSLVHAGLSKSDVAFMWQLWEANPRHGETFDIMAVHSYVFDWKDGVRNPEALDADERDTAPMGFVGNTRDGAHLAKVFNVQLFMQLRGAKDKAIWLTEMGYFVAKHRLGVSESEQAGRLQRTVEFVRQRLTTQPFGAGPRALPARVERLYWFALDDYPSPEGLGSFGVYRPDGSLRPAGEALRALSPLKEVP